MITTEQTWQIGDCLELLPSIDDDSVDLVFPDPPYGIAYHSGRYKNENPHAPIKNDETFDHEFNNK